MFSIFNVDRSFRLGHFKSSLQAEKVWAPLQLNYVASHLLDVWVGEKEEIERERERN